MSEKLRSVNTKFWDDPFVEELTPSEKLLFLYLLTNPLANLLGVYEITKKRICYDTGLTKEAVTNGLERFGRVRKAFYCGNYIILPNWLKNQNLNKNMKIAVVREFNKLPNDIQANLLGNGSESLGNGSEAFGMILERFGKYEVEVEGEIEGEGEPEKTDQKSFEFYAEEVKRAKEYNDPMSLDYVSLCNHLCQKNKDGSWRLPHVLKIKNQLSLNDFSKLYEKAGENLELITSKIDSLQTNVKYHGKYTDIYLTINKWLTKE